MAIPKWIRTQVDAICEACVSPGVGRMSGFEWRAYAPKDNELGCWLVAIAPEQMERVHQGPHDGSEIFDPVDIDLQALPESFSELEFFEYNPGSSDEEPHITICGKVGERELVVLIFFQPFDDATVQEFQAQVLQLARLCGWRVYHTHDSRRRAVGFPDLVLVKGPYLIFAELKCDKGRLTEAQEEWIAALRAAGAPAYCWRPGDWSDIERILREL
jgi:hypothetical protein